MPRLNFDFYILLNVQSNQLEVTGEKLFFFIFWLQMWSLYPLNACTVQHVLSGHSKIDKTKALKTNGSLMKVESVAECSLGAFCNTFDLH